MRWHIRDTTQERMLTILFSIAAFVGLAVFVHELKRDAALFPIARIAPEQALTIAEHHLETVTNTTPSGFTLIQQTILSDTNGSAFIDQVLEQEAARTYKKIFNVNELSYLFLFTNKDDHVTSVSVSVEDGYVTSNTLPPPLPEQQAKHVTRTELEQAGFFAQTLSYNPEDLALVAYSTSTATTTGILGHHFTYEIEPSRIDSSYGTGVQTLTLSIEQTQLSAFSYTFDTPDAFDELLANDNRFTGIAEYVTDIKTNLMVALAFLVVLFAFIQKQLAWKVPAMISVALAPLYAFIELSKYNTVLMSEGVVIGLIIGSIAWMIIVVPLVVFVFLVVAAALHVVRSHTTDRAAIFSSLLTSEFKTKMFAQAMIRSYLFAFMAFGLISSAIFVAETWLGSWRHIPTGSYQELLTPFPTLLFFLETALFAALFEELLYRVFGIALFRKLVKYTVLAALISSFIWALGHFNTYIFPFYYWVVILTMLGLFLSVIYLRYNLTTAIATHFLYNGLVGLNFALANTTLTNIQTGFVVVVVFPALLAIGIYVFTYFDRTHCEEYSEHTNG